MARIESKIPGNALPAAHTAARAAGEVIRRARGGEFRIDHKGATDMVTEVDLASEEKIIAIISEAFPSHRIVAEEGGGGRKETGYTWWIDPLDGTTNFIHGYPCYSVSIALEYRREIILGVIYDPIREELFSACRGEGATLNGRSLSVSTNTSLEDSLLATGFPYNRSRRRYALSVAARLLEKIHGLRRGGSAALDLAYVAAGRLDGYWEFGLKPWDTAAGILLVEEAGGKVSDFRGNRFKIDNGEILASNPVICRPLLEVMAGEDEQKEF